MAEDLELPFWLQYDVNSQLHTPVRTKIIGEIPKWLTGTLYRNGAGLFQVGETKMKHLFDGLSVLHKFVVKDGQVTYQNKLLDSDTLNKSLKVNRLVTNQFGTVAAPDPCKSIFSRYFSHFFPREVTDNTSVNIVPHGDILVAMTETSLVNLVDPETLTRKEKVSMDKIVAVHLATAHPHSDVDGCMYNLGTCFNPANAYNIIRIPPQEKGGDNPMKKATLVATIPSRWKFNIGYNHSFGMSQSYFVVLEQTLVLNTLKLPLMQIMGKGFSTVMANYPDEMSVIHLISRSDGKETVTKYVADAFFCFHFVNCYEEDDHIVVDLCAFDSGDTINNLYISNIQQGQITKEYAKFRRYVLPLKINKSMEDEGKNLVTLSYTSATAVKQPDGTIKCTPDYITGEGADMELPRINYSYNTKKYRYAYGSLFLTGKFALTKLDLETKTTLQWKSECNDEPGEPVFIPRPGATEEDNGIILSPVIPTEPGRPSFLLVLDAKTFKEIARAVVSPDIKMPITFHGSFIPE